MFAYFIFFEMSQNLAVTWKDDGPINHSRAYVVGILSEHLTSWRELVVDTLGSFQFAEMSNAQGVVISKSFHDRSCVFQVDPGRSDGFCIQCIAFVFAVFQDIHSVVIETVPLRS